MNNNTASAVVPVGDGGTVIECTPGWTLHREDGTPIAIGDDVHEGERIQWRRVERCSTRREQGRIVFDGDGQRCANPATIDSDALASGGRVCDACELDLQTMRGTIWLSDG